MESPPADEAFVRKHLHNLIYDDFICAGRNLSRSNFGSHTCANVFGEKLRRADVNLVIKMDKLIIPIY